MVDRLTRRVGLGPGDSVAEIGAGTGHFTRMLAARGWRVSALEPVEEMRCCAPELPGVTWSAGTFESPGLPAASQSWVVAAQAFHWVDAAEALPQVRGILRPGGWFTIMWNAHHLSQHPVLQRTYAALRHHVPAYDYLDRTTLSRRVSSRVLGTLPHWLQAGISRVSANAGGSGRISRGLQLPSTGDFVGVTYDEVRHRVAVSREAYLDLWRSRNRLRAIAGDEAFERFLAAVAADLERHAIDEIDVPYVCGAWSARAR